MALQCRRLAVWLRNSGLWTKSGVIGNLADLGAVLLCLDDGPLRKQAPYGHRQLPILPDIALDEPCSTTA